VQQSIFAEKGTAEKGIIDTHCHLWRLELLRRAWTPASTIFRTFEPKDLAKDCNPIGVYQCVLVEAGMTAEDNQALEEVAATSELISGIVPFLDLESPNLEEQLDYWACRPKFRGIRMRFEGHPNPEIMTRSTTLEGFKSLSKRGIPFDFLVTTKNLKDILTIYEHVPELQGVIEHMGKPDLRRWSDREEWSRRITAVAKHTSALCKLSIGPRAEDMEEIYANQGQGWPIEAIQPYVHLLLDQFGAERLMWGSDWPLLLLESDYGGTYQTMRSALGQLDPADEVQIFRNTAVHFYGLESVDQAKAKVS
jgi:L-fuconolactonase